MSEDDYWYVFVFSSAEWNTKKRMETKFLNPIKKFKKIFKVYKQDNKNVEIARAHNPYKNYEGIFPIPPTNGEKPRYDEFTTRALKELELMKGYMIDGKISELDFAEFIYDQIKIKLEVDLGIELKESRSKDQKEIYLMMRTCDENLKLQAEYMKYKLPLNKELIEEESTKEDFRQKEERTMRLENEAKFKRHDPFGPYTIQAKESIYRPKNGEDLFGFNDKVRILFSMFTSAIDLSELKQMKLLKLIFHHPLKMKQNLKN